MSAGTGEFHMTAEGVSNRPEPIPYLEDRPVLARENTRIYPAMESLKMFPINRRIQSSKEGSDGVDRP